MGHRSDKVHMKLLTGRRALVTGAASGIGAAIVALFRAEGALVAGLDMHVATNADCNVVADVRSEEQLTLAIADIRCRIGMPDILIHAAALSPRGGSLDMTPEMYADTYNVNVIGAVRLMQHCVPEMRKQGLGSIILLSSINASFATPTHVAYAASKAALNSITMSAAVELAPDGIRVNAIAPASIDTPMLRASYQQLQDGERALSDNVHRHPLARFGLPEEVAQLALFLASDRSAWITGAIHPIDGGASATRR